MTTTLQEISRAPKNFDWKCKVYLQIIFYFQ